MGLKEIRDFIQDYINTMNEEQIKHFKECAIKLTGEDNLINVFSNYSYNDFVSLNILDTEEIQIMDLIVDEIHYMLEDDNIEENEISEIEILISIAKNKGYSVYEHIHGDTGMQIIGIYNKDSKWYLESPIERSNSVSTKMFNTFIDIKEYIEKIL